MGASTIRRGHGGGAGAVLLLALVGLTGAVPLTEFYPFGLSVGPNVSQQALPPSHTPDSASLEARLRVPINFYDVAYDAVFVNTNGLLSFLTDIPQFLNLQFPLDYPVIAPFYANVDTSASGTVYFYESEEVADLQKAAENVRRSFSSSTFQPTAVFVATWERVGYFSQGADKVNTFQVAVSSDGTQSYAEFLYADDGVQWVRGVSRQQGLPDARAQVGFVGGDGRFFEVHGSGTDHP